MIRSLTAIGFALALVGTAHAESAVKIETTGKTVRQVHAEIYQAAKQVCAGADHYDLASGNECVELTYQNGLAQMNGHAKSQSVDYVAQTANGSVLARP
ncbi:MAG: hypothetical protein ACYDD1_01290 [Caulobacteraceae bacterium]